MPTPFQKIFLVAAITFWKTLRVVIQKIYFKIAILRKIPRADFEVKPWNTTNGGHLSFANILNDTLSLFTDNFRP